MPPITACALVLFAAGLAADAASIDEIRARQEQIFIVPLAATVALTITLLSIQDGKDRAREAAERGVEPALACQSSAGQTSPPPPAPAAKAEPGPPVNGYGQTHLPLYGIDPFQECENGLDDLTQLACPKAYCQALAPQSCGLPNTASDDLDNKLAAQLAEKGMAVPDWLAPENCAACGRKHAAICFLCPTCQLLTPKHRVTLVFDLLDSGDATNAWTMAEAIIRDVRGFLKHAAVN